MLQKQVLSDADQRRRPLSGPSYTAVQRARLLESMNFALRKASDMLTPTLRPPLVSKAAATAAADLGLGLRNQTRHTQPKIDPGRTVFHFEHFALLWASATRSSGRTPSTR